MSVGFSTTRVGQHSLFISEKEWNLSQAVPLWAELSQDPGEVVCVTSEALDAWLENLDRPPLEHRSVDDAWHMFEQMSHVEEVGKTVQQSIAKLPLPPIAPAPKREFHDPGPVRIVRSDCAPNELIQTIVGPLAADCLRHDAADHDAVLAFFRQKYQARLICLEWDSMLFDVPRPPQSHDDIRELLWQHFIYCDGEQEVDLEADGPAYCRPSGQWSFWWD